MRHEVEIQRSLKDESVEEQEWAYSVVFTETGEGKLLFDVYSIRGKARAIDKIADDLLMAAAELRMA